MHASTLVALRFSATYNGRELNDAREGGLRVRLLRKELGRVQGGVQGGGYATGRERDGRVKFVNRGIDVWYKRVCFGHHVSSKTCDSMYLFTYIFGDLSD